MEQKRWDDVQITALEDKALADAWLGSRVAVILLVMAAVAVRLGWAIAAPIWYDEAFQALVWNLPSLSHVVAAAALDYWPPLWFVLGWPLVHLLGDSLLVLRALSLLASLLILPMAWYLTRGPLGTWQPWAQAGLMALVALTPYQVWMAADARAYSFLSLLYLGLIALGLHGGRWAWAGYGALVAVWMWTHPIGVFYIVPLGLLLALHWRNQPREVLGLFIATAVGGGTFLPWLPTFLSQVGNSEYWLTDASQTWLNITGAVAVTWWAWATPQIQVGGWAMLLVLLGLFLWLAPAWQKSGSKQFTAALIAFGLWAGPLALMWAAGQIQPLIYYRILSPLAVPLMLWAVLVIQRARPAWQWGLSAGLAFLLLWGVLVVFTHPEAKAGGIGEMANTLSREYREGDLVVHVTATSLLPLAYHTPALPHRLLTTDYTPRYMLDSTIAAMGGIQYVEDREIIAHLAGGGRALFVFSGDIAIYPYDEHFSRSEAVLEAVENREELAAAGAWHFAEIHLLKLEGIGEMPNLLEKPEAP